MALLVEQTFNETELMTSHCVNHTSSKVNKVAVPTLKEAKQTNNQTNGADQNSDPSDGSLWQMSAGPAALAQLMIYQAIALYADIISLQSEQRKAMISCQSNAAVAQSNETISEGKAAKSAAWAQAITMAAGAVAEVGTTIGVKRIVTKGATEELNELSKQTKPMELVEKQSKTSTGIIGQTENLENEIANNPFATKIQTGDYSEEFTKTYDERVDEKYRGFNEIEMMDESESPADRKNRLMERAKNAVQEELERGVALVKKQDPTWESRFYERFDAKQRSLQEISARSNTAANYANMAGGIINSLSKSVSSVAQGYGQAAQARHRAAAGLEGIIQQMENPSDFAQAMAKAYDAELQEIQVLEKIHQANSVNG